jgi:hypothetical protein
MDPVTFPDHTTRGDGKAIAAGVDTFLGTVGGELPPELGADLDERKAQSQQAEEDVPTPLRFAGEALFIKPHGAQRHWRWVLHSPSLHLELGRGKFNHIIARARLSAAFLWEHGFDVALMLLYAFLYDLFGHDFKLHVSELHVCVDVAGWALALGDAIRFITRGHNVAPCDESAKRTRRTSKWRGTQTRRQRRMGRRLCTRRSSRDCAVGAVAATTSAAAPRTPAAFTTRRPRSSSRAKTGCEPSGRATAGMGFRG